MNQFSTPMMKQYRKIKEEYKDCLLFYRMGDFYELFLEDAYIGAKILDITLTGKSNGKNEKIPMAGVPYHAVDNYIHKSVKAGYKVAICEQLSPPTKYGLVERAVVRIVTPGTILDDKALDKKENNFIISLLIEDKTISISAADISTGYFQTSEFTTENYQQLIIDEIARLHPSECILSPSLYNNSEILSLLKYEKQMNIYCYHAWNESTDQSEEYLKKHFDILSLAPFNIESKLGAQKTSAALLSYLQQTQKSAVKHIDKILFVTSENTMQLNKASIINLELFSTIREHDVKGSLLSVLDETITGMGGRMLREWIRKPLLDEHEIRLRHNAVDELIKNTETMTSIREFLKRIVDIERLLSRLSVNLGNARDLNTLRDSLTVILQIKNALKNIDTELMHEIEKNISEDLQKIIHKVTKTICEEPNIDIKSGNIINPGIDQELDVLRKKVFNSRAWIAELEKTEREETGISSLKVRYNKVFGFYIEISKSNLHAVPSNYFRKQTIVNGERFITPELKEHENIILHAEEEINKKEFEIFQKLLDYVLSFIRDIQKAAIHVAILDCLSNFAYISQKNRYIKPELIDTGEIIIKQGRHPVVEKLLHSDNQFVPNDIYLGGTQQVLIITGPNMAGKSVFIRQVGLILLMNQIGCFVPAEEARLSIVDKIFVRSGASDVITSGLSTFMVEMVETAHILNSATKNSLVIMDEIGRGTSTYDGMSIAWAVAQHLVINGEQTPKTLFATHYHELQSLEESYPNKIVNYQMAVIEEDNKPIFLHTIKPGGASSSFGIAVAKLAGIPESVVMQAEKKLSEMERKTSEKDNEQFTSFSQTSSIIEHVLLKELLDLDIHQMTPLDALNFLAKLKDQLRLSKNNISFLEAD